MMILGNATLVQLDPARIEPATDIAIENGIILDTGQKLTEKYPEAEVISMTDKLIMPGIVCAHNHFYSALARGMTTEILPAGDFLSILKNLWWRLDRAIDEDILHASAMVGALEAIKAGTTAVVDHHASPVFISGSLQTLEDAFIHTGLRGILCYETTDRNGEDGMQAGIEENIAFANRVDARRRSGQKPLVEAAIGGHAPFTLGEAALERMREAVQETGRGIHVHVSEDQHDAIFSQSHYKEDPLARLDRFRLLNSKSLIAHGVHLTSREIQLLNDVDGFLLHNPRSNMNNHVGYTINLPRMKNVALGTDGIGSNMFEELKFAYFKHKDVGGPWWPENFVRILQNGNRILDRYFDSPFGRIEAGFAADLTILDYDMPSPLISKNTGGHFVFGMSSRDVQSVMIDGKFVYRDRQFPFDTQPIYEKAAAAARRLWETM